MQYRILGPLAVAKDGSDVVIGSGKQRALLALLLLNANEAVSTDRLIDQLWGESRSASATKVLQNYVSKLRRLLGDGVLITRAHGYELRVEPGELDVDRFDDLVADGRRALAAGDPEHAAAVLAKALALWRGPPLADLAYEPFAAAEIERLDGLRLAALIERIDADLELGRHDALIGELETLVARYPLQERLRGQLMLALYRSGRQAEALRVYKETRRVLVDELGIEPSQELQQLERAILVHDPSLEPPPIKRVGAGSGDRGRASARRRSPPRRRDHGRGDPCGPRTRRQAALSRRLDRRHRSEDGQARRRGPGHQPTRKDRRRHGPGGRFELRHPRGTMSEIDPRSLTVADTRAVSAVTGVLSSIAFAGDQGWVVTYNGILALMARSGGVTPITFERNGYGDLSDVAVTGSSIWVASQRQRAVFKIDRTTLRLVARVPIPAVPLAVAADGEAVWVAGFDKSSKAGVLMRIDPAHDSIAATIPLPGIPADLAAGYGAVWVTVDSRNAVWRIDPATSSVAQTIPVGRSPVAVAVGEGSVWVVNAKDGTVSRIDPRTNDVAAPIRVGGSPQDVAIGSGRIWVAGL